MSCAMGVAKIAESVDTDAALQFSGEIRHQENRAFRTVLDLDIESVDASSQLESDAVVLVDHNAAGIYRGPDRRTGRGRRPPSRQRGRHEVHRRADGLRCGVDDPRRVPTHDIGATMADEEDSSEFEISPELATGLLYGILSDTNHLTNGCSRAEFDACAALFSGIDEDLLDRIANPQVSDDVLQVKATAITQKRVEGAPSPSATSARSQRRRDSPGRGRTHASRGSHGGRRLR